MRRYRNIAILIFAVQLLLIPMPLLIGILVEPNPFAIMGAMLSLFFMGLFIHSDPSITKVIKTKYGYMYYDINEEGHTTCLNIKKPLFLFWENMTEIYIDPNSSKEDIIERVNRGLNEYYELKGIKKQEEEDRKRINRKLNTLGTVEDSFEKQLKELENE